MFKGTVTRDFLPPIFSLKQLHLEPSIKGRMEFAENLFSQSYLSFKFFSSVGYNGRGFRTSWNTAEKIFSSVGYSGRGFPPVWDKPYNNFKVFDVFFLLYPTKQMVIYIYFIPEQFFFRCIPPPQRNLL
jgi:hypothetical protein